MSLKLLALDTASEGCSAALSVNGSLTERFELAPRGHTRLLMPMVRELLREQGLVPADLDVLAFGCGPGSFTGLRIVTGVVQGLAYGLQLPVVPVSSLASVAAEAIVTLDVEEGGGLAVAFDARMGEVYWGCFINRDGLPQAIGEAKVCAPGAVELPEFPDSWVAAGSGWALQAQIPASVVQRIHRQDATLVPRAAQVARLALRDYATGVAVAAEQAQPVYLRDEVTWKKLPGR